MSHRLASRLLFLVIVAMLIPVCAHAKPKKKTYNNSSEQLFTAALRTARERHVVTYVNEKMLMFTFETGRSFTSEGFVANASIEPEGEGKATLIINVQNKKGLSWGAGDRMADKFYDQVTDELAGETRQASAIKSQEKAVTVPEPKAVPNEPSITKPVGANSLTSTRAASAVERGRILLTSNPDGAEVYVDDGLVGNAPATLNLPPGKHTVKVSQQGFKPWTREVSVFAGSETNLKVALEKE
ncbi:MAG TPA: PEGA domain-containing protein [Candidatus Angelobacter sp.]|nr:PEGA domain-containing protein [Candidatus Angelobacter sp.]